MALSGPRRTAKCGGMKIRLPITASVVPYVGSLAAIDATGNAIPARKAADLTAAGCVVEVHDDYVIVERGCFFWDNDSNATNKVTEAHVGKDCYMLDDCTVTMLATDTSRAGKVLGFEGDQVIVETR